MRLPAKEQFQGCLVGQCLGDALGFPVEGEPQAACLQYIEKTLRTGNAPRGCPPFPFGQYTDDSQLARELIISIVEKERFSPRDYAQRIAAVFQQNRIVGKGAATEQAAQRLIAGAGWEESGTPAPSAGNGSAMRAAPIGLLFYDDPEQLVKAAFDQSRITHKDPRSCAGSIAVAGATALALTQDTVDPYTFLEQLSEWVEETDENFAIFLQQLGEWVEMPPDEAFPLIARAGQGQKQAQTFDGLSPFVIGTVLWSLYSFLKHPDDYWQTVCSAISCGGDVDTTAAMAGAISGARLGIKAVPSDLAAQLTDRGGWGYDELTGLAGKWYDTALK